MENDRIDPASQRQILNFSAGPGLMAKKVLARAQSEFASFSQGHSLMELSHRSNEFEQVLRESEADLRELLQIPSGFKVLWMAGGASLQFSAVALNLAGGDRVVDYVVTGAWSEKGAEEAGRLLGSDRVNVVVSTAKSNHNGDLPAADKWKFSADPAYVFYCDNETVHGVELGEEFPFDRIPKSVPIVCDMSSNILSKPIDVSKFGVIFAGAQKNMGPAGVTVVIIREDLITPTLHTPGPLPLLLDYSTYAKNSSMYNTPPTFPIYMCGLVFQWLKNDIYGLQQMSKLNAEKSSLLYAAIHESGSFYSCPVVNPRVRSRMNVPFIVHGGKGSEMEKLFLKEAEERGMVQLRGHRSVGGVRASLYNAMSLDGVKILVEFMKEFQAKHA